MPSSLALMKNHCNIPLGTYSSLWHSAPVTLLNIIFYLLALGCYFFVSFLYLLHNYFHYFYTLVTIAKASHIVSIPFLFSLNYPAEYEVIVGLTCEAQYIGQ